MRRGVVVPIAVAAAAAGAALLLWPLWAGRLSPGPGRDSGAPTDSPSGPLSAEAPPAPPGLAARTAIASAPPATSVDAARARGGTLIVTVRGWGPPEDPLPDAEVVVVVGNDRVRRTTDTSGVARFAIEQPGRYAVWAFAENHSPRGERDVVVERGTERAIEFGLRKGVPFDGRAVSAIDGRPISGATIRMAITESGMIGLSSPWYRPEDILVTGAEGQFHVRGVPEDSRVSLGADAPGFHRTLMEVDADDMPEGGAVMRMTSGGRIVGVVRDRDGAPVSGATVIAFPSGASHPDWAVARNDEFEAMSGLDGAFRLEGTALGQAYVVRARAPGYGRSAPMDGVVSTSATPDAKADPVLRRPATLVVRARDTVGKPAERVEVTIDHGEVGIPSQWVGPDGACRIEGVFPGEHDVTFKSLLYRWAGTEVSVGEGKTVEIAFTLDPGARIEGVLLGADDKPLGGANMEIEAADEGGPKPHLCGHAWRSEENGTFRVGGLDPGDYLVSASRGSSVAPPVRVRAPAAGVRLRCVLLGRAMIRLRTPDGAAYAGGVGLRVQSERGGFRGYNLDICKPDGGLVIENINAGPNTLEIEPDGWPPLKVEFTMIEGASLDLGSCELAAGVPLSGTVRDLSGSPVVGALVSLYRHGTTATDEAGRFLLEHLDPESESLRVQAEGFLSAEQDFAVAPGMPALQVILRRGALVRGAVKDAQGAPVGSIRVDAVRLDAKGSPLGGNRESDWETSKDDGRIAFRVPEGRWRFSLRDPNGKSTSPVEMDLAEGETRNLDLTLPVR